MELQFEIENQTITRRDQSDIYSDVKNYVSAAFSFSEDWNGTVKTAVFRKGDVVYNVMLEDDRIPCEKLGFFTAGRWAVSVYGGDLITTGVALVDIHQSGYLEGETPPPPTDTVYQQLMQISEETQEIAQSVRDDADAGVFNGKDGKDGADGTTAIDDAATAADKTWSSKKISEDIVQRRDSVDVKTHGAVGDGIADDTEAVRRAVAAAEENGKSVFFSQGTYLITDRIVIRRPMEVYGAGRDASVILFRGAPYDTEAAYDDVNYEESHAAFCLRENMITLRDFTIDGAGIDGIASTWNGVILHFTAYNNEKPYYGGCGRCTVCNVRISNMKNGIFVYAGWGRIFRQLEIADCTEAGISYQPLEGINWSCSGDLAEGCNIVGCPDGFYAKKAHQMRLQNCVFEYNTRALSVYDCPDIVIANCWNEQNTENISVTGSASFSGGYNIVPETVTHVPIDSRSVVEFCTAGETVAINGDDVLFKQQGGIILKGVNIGGGGTNVLENSTFETFDGWNTIVPGSVHADSTVQYNGHNTLVVDIQGRQEDYNLNFGAGSDHYPVTPGEPYKLGVYVKTDQLEGIDRGVYMRIDCYTADDYLSGYFESEIPLMANGVWEYHEMELAAQPETIVKLAAQFYVGRNGVVNFAEPFLSKLNVTREDVVLKQKDSASLQVIDYKGDVIGTVPFTPASE